MSELVKGVRVILSEQGKRSKAFSQEDLKGLIVGKQKLVKLDSDSSLSDGASEYAIAVKWDNYKTIQRVNLSYIEREILLLGE